MGRGRAIDKNLPLTRSLTAQRDYRARKSAHLKSLDETVARLTEENAALRQEVAALRAQVQHPGQMAHAQLEAVAAARDQLVLALDNLDGVMRENTTSAQQWHGSGPVRLARPAHAHAHVHGAHGHERVLSQLSERERRPEALNASQSRGQWRMHAYSEEMPTLSPSGSRRTLLPNEQNDNEPNENDENASESANVGNNSNNVHAGVDGECCYGLFDCSNLLDVSVESDGEAATRHRHDRGSNGHHSHSHDHQTPEDQDECCFGVVQCSDPKS